MRILVTGASGHVGGAIAAHLQRGGHEVVGLSRRPPRVEELAGQLQLDIGSPEAGAAIAAALGSCDAVVHAAAALDKSPPFGGLIAANCLGTEQMLVAAKEAGARCFVYISGVHVVGSPSELPVTEDHPAAPATAYHATKLFGERLVRVAGGEGMTAATLRLTSPVGPGMPDGRILPVFVRSAAAGEKLTLAGRGTRRQNYVDVRDAAGAVECLLERPSDGIFNIAGARSYSNRELAELCVRLMESDSDVVFEGSDPEEDLRWEVSIEKARRQLSWVPEFDLADSIRAVAAEFSLAA
ncbi:MAG: NAD(P)-dependent oxidoreductase [Actinomycetota bacterium]